MFQRAVNDRLAWRFQGLPTRSLVPDAGSIWGSDIGEGPAPGAACAKVPDCFPAMVWG